MYAFPSLSMMIMPCCCSESVNAPLCASWSCSSSLCLMIFDSRLVMYCLLHPGSLLFNLLPDGRTILTGLIPTSNSSGMSTMNAQWSPTPYPNGITHALLMLRLLVTQKPSMGLEPWKNVAPGCVLVCCTTASLMSSPALSDSAVPKAPLRVC